VSERTPREILAEADWHRQREQAANLARAKIRLGEKPVQRRGLLGFRKKPDAYRELEFDRDETNAIYEALAIVQRDYREAAKRLEEGVFTKGSGS
jgi:hypothetical protein